MLPLLCIDFQTALVDGKASCDVDTSPDSHNVLMILRAAGDQTFQQTKYQQNNPIVI